MGILHRLRFATPEKQFEPVREDVVCRYMKVTTLESVRDSLTNRQYLVRGPRGPGWRRVIHRMVALG